MARTARGRRKNALHGDDEVERLTDGFFGGPALPDGDRIYRIALRVLEAALISLQGVIVETIWGPTGDLLVGGTAIG